MGREKKPVFGDSHISPCHLCVGSPSCGSNQCCQLLADAPSRQKSLLAAGFKSVLPGQPEVVVEQSSFGRQVWHTNPVAQALKCRH